MLEFVDQHARRHGVKRIIGKVVRRDYNDWPQLLDWYKKNDFVVIAAAIDDEPNIVAHISKEMGP